jgi:hypothetical protein
MFFTGGGVERMRIASNGNIGIGTNNPGNILQVGNGERLRVSNGANDYTTIGSSDSGANTRIVVFGSTSTSPGQIGYAATSTGSHIFFTTDSTTERMRIASNGNIGIGTNNPGSILQVGNGGRLRIANNDYSLIGSKDINDSTNTKIVLWHTGNLDYYVPDTKSHVFYTSTGTGTDTERLRIASNGNIGIGTNVSPNDNIPASLLHIRGTNPTITITGQGHTGATSRIDLSSYDPGINPYTCSLLAVDDGLYSSTFMINLKTRGAVTTSQFTAMTISSNGNIGIGTTDTGTHKLHVAASVSTITMTGAYYGNNGVGATFSGPYHNITAKFIGPIWSTEYLVISSDSRIKEDIQDINDDNALQSILSIEPKTYKYVDKLERGDKKVYGFMAQQIREVIPEAISIQTSYIPNIYLVADYNNYIISLPSQPTKVVIKVDDKIKCYDKDNKELLVEVIEVIDDLTFRIKDIEYSDTKIFVYGTFVEDFHTLNKDYIFTLNVCATQELHRRIEAQSLLLKSQDDRIKDLETKMERILSGTA